MSPLWVASKKPEKLQSAEWSSRPFMRSLKKVTGKYLANLPTEKDRPAMEMDPEDREKCRRNLREFIRKAWPIVEPARPLIDGWHVGAICDHLEAVSRGEIKRLVIAVPPGHLKSLSVSVLWFPWEWSWNPMLRAIFSSYAEELALRDNVRARNVIESEWYQTNFSARDGWEMASDQNAKAYFRNTKKGERQVLSVGGKGTGFRGDRCVVDDALNATEAPSKIARDAVIFWWDQVMSQRFNDMSKASAVVIGQRLHQNDLTGYLLEQGGYEYLCLPAEYDPKRQCITYHTVTVKEEGEEPYQDRREFWRDPRHFEKELLFPEMFGRDVIARSKLTLGEYGFAAQYSQLPAPAGGGMFKREWWRFWKPDGVGAMGGFKRPDGCTDDPAYPLPADFDEVLISVDANFRSKTGSDPVAIHVIAAKGALRFLLYRVHGPFGFTGTVKHLRAVCELYPDAGKKIIEAKANGDAIVDSLIEEIPGIMAVDPKGGKEARAFALQPQVQAGQCYLPEGAPWLDEFISEFDLFPNGKHDDDVDSFSQGILELRKPRNAIDYLAEMEE